MFINIFCRIMNENRYRHNFIILYFYGKIEWEKKTTFVILLMWIYRMLFTKRNIKILLAARFLLHLRDLCVSAVYLHTNNFGLSGNKQIWDYKKHAQIQKVGRNFHTIISGGLIAAVTCAMIFRRNWKFKLNAGARFRKLKSGLKTRIALVVLFFRTFSADNIH